MKYDITSDTVTIYLDGRLDMSNAKEVDQSIDEIFSQNERDNVVLDLLNLIYISSVGLRIILKLKKNSMNFKIFVSYIPKIKRKIIPRIIKCAG